MVAPWFVLELPFLGEGDEVFTLGVGFLDEEVLLSGELGTGDNIVDTKGEAEVGYWRGLAGH